MYDFTDEKLHYEVRGGVGDMCVRCVLRVGVQARVGWARCIKGEKLHYAVRRSGGSILPWALRPSVLACLRNT